MYKNMNAYLRRV